MSQVLIVILQFENVRLSALIYKGFRNPLEYKDLFSLNRSLSAEVLNLEFNTLWKKERKQTNRKPSIHHVIYTFAYREFSGIYLMGLFADLSITFLPFILKYFLKYISISKEYSTSYHEGLIYIFSMLLLSLMNTLFLNLFLQRSVVVGMQVQQAVRSLIYQKSLVLSLSARQEFDAGRISTLIATDTTRIFTCLCYVTLLWAGPLQAILIFGFLVAEIGYSSLYGVILLILLSPLQGYFYKKLSAIRKIVAPITDTRMKLMNEVLLGIRLIKYFSWEDSFAKKLSDIRSRELKLTFRKSIIGAFSRTVVLVIPLFCSLISFVSYGLTNNSLNSSSIFPALSWFAQLQFPLSLVPMAFGFLAEYKIAVSRIDEFLNAQELQERVKIGYNKQYSIEMENCNFVWGSKKDSFRLKNINMKIPTGSLVAIVGKVGSGKSSLLNAILGEMKRELGSVSINGSLGYSPQQAWIQNTSLKQNILFGKPYNRHLYSLAVRNCSLDKDIALLSEGDETEIGEKGINLSGGQKQRVNLARCVYFGSSIVLMDDPLSAVDAHVGKNMFENCIVNGLQGKTRILVTHQLHLLSKVDIIIVMDAGEIVEQGPYQQLLHKKDGIFSSLASSYGGISTTTVKEKRFSNIKFLNESEEVNLNINKSDDKKNLMSIEERIIGNVSSSVYLGYAKSSSVVLVCFFALALLIFNLAKLGTDYWLIIWSNNQIPHFSNFQYIAVFFAWGLLQAIAIFSFGILVAFIGIAASKNLHDKAMARVLRAPISFFDTTPLGRIVNRFSKDIDGIDNTLSDGLASFLTTISVALSSVVLICYNLQHFFALIMLSLLFFYFILQKVFRANSRELQRLESISSSPLYSHFNDTVDGLSTIRAYHKESFAMEVCNERIDQVSTPFFLLYSCQRWFSIRMDILGALLVFSVGIFAVFERFEVSTAVVGLSVSYALQITGVLSAAVRSFAETESSMNAVERMQHYGNNIPEEAAPVIENSRPPKNWPSSGTIKFEDLDVSYSKDLPLVIKNINFTIKDKQQIGVVGRTGSGKSTMMNALFRIMEPSSGTIYVDGIDIRTIGLSDLRRGLAIIPQDPILFSGTFRSNLDPFGVHSDNDLWNALERANLKSKVMENKSGLDSIIQEGGENLSVGQRQLLCLGRAMLKKPRILVMDEATANVDFETDNIIQKCLREDFKQSTILTIAHRLNTIIDYDLVLVLERGEIAELGSPRELLHIENGKFLALVDETGLTNAKLLKSLAK
ncbi:hypothetical protein HDU92_000983 [Lobulomyces angularis]|nr:hypothetical protein HDU92_000983 [Lobulomyces angularis]